MLRETEDRLGYRPGEYVVLHCRWRMDWWMRKGAEHLVFLGPEGEPGKDLEQGEHGNNPEASILCGRSFPSPWVSFYLTFLLDSILSFLSEVFCSCPQVLELPRYCRGKEVILHLQYQAGSLGRHQIQAPSLGLQAEAVVLEGVGDRKTTGNERVKEGRRACVELRQNLGKHTGCLTFEVVVFWVWVFS